MNKNNSLYKKLLLSITIAIVIIIIVLSSIVYFNFQNIMLLHIFNSEKNSLSQVSYNAKIMTEYATTFALQLFSDKDVSQALYRDSLENIDLNSIIKKLETYENSTPFVDSIYIYNGNMKKFFIGSLSYILYPVYDEDSFYDGNIPDIIGSINDYTNINPIPRQYKLPSYSAAESTLVNVYSFVFKGYPVKNSAIVLNVSKKWMEKAIESFDINAQGKTIVIDSKGLVVADSMNRMFLDDSSKSEYIRSIIDTENVSGYFVDYVDGEKSLVIYTKYDWLNWSFVRVIPYNSIMSRIEKMKLSTLFICFSILMLGFLVSFLMSKKLYKPIDSLLIKLNRLEYEKRSSFYTLKQEFLKNMVMNEDNNHFDKNIKMRFVEFNIELDPEKPIVMLLFTIDEYTEFCSRYNYNDRNLFKFSIINTASELLGPKYKNELVDIGEEKIIAIINVDEEQPDSCYSHLEQVISDIQLSVRQHLQISLSVTVGSKGHLPGNIKYLYDEVSRLSNYRLFYGHKCIIFAEKINEHKSHEYSYPVKKAESLTEFLKQGKIEEVKEIFEDIIQEVVNHSYTVFHMAVTRLAFDVNAAVDIIEINSELSLECDFSTFISKLNRLETIDAVKEHFFRLFEHITSKLRDRKDSRQNNLIKKVQEIINENFLDQNLCIDSISVMVNISPAYLGRLFKKSIGKSIPDYINKVRMEKAGELLVSTSYPIDVIAEQTGFTNSPYFYKVFKKYHGVTPHEYRLKHKCQKNQIGEIV